jgi:hypothetical protein
MHNKERQAEGRASFQFLKERRARLFINSGVGRGGIYQIAGVGKRRTDSGKAEIVLEFPRLGRAQRTGTPPEIAASEQLYRRAADIPAAHGSKMHAARGGDVRACKWNVFAGIFQNDFAPGIIVDYLANGTRKDDSHLSQQVFL